MVAIRRLSSTVAACALTLIFPSLASAHILAVTAGPSQCVSPLNGSYTATVTVTETNFYGTIEKIPVGQNVRQAAGSTDPGNTGLNQNYFTTGAVGTQTGPANLGQPTSFTSPTGASATQQFTVTTSVPETYVLGNSYMRTPSSTTINPPHGGCAPPPPPPSAPAVSVTSASTCTVPLNGTYSSTVVITSDQAFTVPAGTTSGTHGVNFLTPNVSGAPSSINAGSTTFTLTGLTQPTVYVIGAQGGNVASVTLAPPTGGCTPPSTPPTTPTPPTLPPTSPAHTCAPGQTMSSSGACTTPAVLPACHVKAHSNYRVRAGEANTVIVSVGRSGVKVRLTMPGGKTLTGTTNTHGTLSFTVRPKRSGTISVRSTSCTGVARVKVFAPKVAATHTAPSFTG